MKRIAFFRLFAIAFSLLPLATFAQGQGSPVSLRYSGGGTYYLVERSNWSKYENGAYIGLTHRETRANVTALAAGSDGQRFSGFFYVLEETLRDMSKAARGLDETLEAAFTVLPDGRMRFTKDPGYPALREFPVYPATAVRPGDRWQAAGTRIVDPRNDGKRSALPIMVEYEFVGQESWHYRDVYRLRAKFATRVNKYLKAKGDDPNLKDASGTHDVDILVDAESGAAVLILDRLDETFMYSDGSSVRYRGNTALFTEAPVPIDETSLIPKIAGISSQAESAIPPGRKGIDGGTRDGGNGEDTFPENPRPQTQTQPSSPASVAVVTPTETAPMGGTHPETAKKPLEPVVNAPSDASGGEPFTVEKTPQGIKLSVRDVRFAADSDAILPEEAWRIDAIADALKLVPGGKFLVEGHTASVGKPEGERLLSIARAKKITDELVKRGLLPEQFMYSGYGGTRPVADNATNAGRAQNRRVEITILE
jgi:outer membrane protein OmpA-like peptidoglycan-associated protein